LSFYSFNIALSLVLLVKANTIRKPIFQPQPTSNGSDKLSFTMAATPPAFEYYDSDDDLSDAESLASLQTDDGVDHPPHKILAEISHRNRTWYLVQWKDCPVIRSSWEGPELFDTRKEILEEWGKEKERQKKGESQPLDIAAFNRRLAEVELAENQRRTLRRLKKRVNRVLSIVSA
jgi:hypothetical protein